MYGLNKEEREELTTLKQELFGNSKFAILDESTNHSKIYRYNELVKKMQELRKACLN